MQKGGKKMKGNKKTTKEDVVIIENLGKVALVKKSKGLTGESWKKDIYGFECGNWTCKC